MVTSSFCTVKSIFFTKFRHELQQSILVGGAERESLVSSSIKVLMVCTVDTVAVGSS